MGNGVERSPSDDRLEMLVDLWLASYGSENTRAAYGGDLWAFSRWCEDHGRLTLRATTADLAQYLAWSQESGASASTLARRRSSLGSFFDFAGESDSGRHNPAALDATSSSQSASPTAVLADRDAEALLRASDRLGPKPAALVRLLMLDGLRLGEVLAADVADFRHKTTQPALVVPRRDRRRTVGLSLPTVRRLRHYLGRRNRGPLLLSDTPGRHGARLSRFGADYLLKQAAQTARLDTAISANTLRRRYVAAASKAGIHIDDIRDHVGHRDVRTTRRYLEPDVNPTVPSVRARYERR
jgi:integrase/recombinase XerD